MKYGFFVSENMFLSSGWNYLSFLHMVIDIPIDTVAKWNNHIIDTLLQAHIDYKNIATAQIMWINTPKRRPYFYPLHIFSPGHWRHLVGKLYHAIT